jgi:glycosyltransferase involved in cell wall biosynthesis
MKKILVLYRELAGYIVNCFEYVAKHENIHVEIVAYPVAAEAPFQFTFSNNITVHRRSEISDEQLAQMVTKGNYDLIFCGGWFDKGYLDALKHKGKTPTVIGFDKQWKGSLKDRLATLYLKLKVTPFFDFAFVPGIEQVRFARKMGFAENRIKTGIYVCDNIRFNEVHSYRKLNPSAIKNRVIYAGRYIPEKDIENLMQVASEIANQRNDDWEFHFIGTGALWDKRVQHPKIVHHGFLDGQQLDEIMRRGAIFILPSLFEPWGVVVNEFAMAGYPLILSDQVGARTALLKANNGRVFAAGNKDQMKQALMELMDLPQAELMKLGEQSHLSASKINEDGFKNAILEMMN